MSLASRHQPSSLPERNLLCRWYFSTQEVLVNYIRQGNNPYDIEKASDSVEFSILLHHLGWVQLGKKLLLERDFELLISSTITHCLDGALEFGVKGTECVQAILRGIMRPSFGDNVCHLCNVQITCFSTHWCMWMSSLAWIVCNQSLASIIANTLSLWVSCYWTGLSHNTSFLSLQTIPCVSVLIHLLFLCFLLSLSFLFSLFNYYSYVLYILNAMPLGASCYMNFELNFELMQSQSQAHSNSTHNISSIDGGTTYAHSTNGRSNEKS